MKSGVFSFFLCGDHMWIMWIWEWLSVRPRHKIDWVRWVSCAWAMFYSQGGISYSRERFIIELGIVWGRKPTSPCFPICSPFSSLMMLRARVRACIKSSSLRMECTIIKKSCNLMSFRGLIIQLASDCCNLWSSQVVCRGGRCNSRIMTDPAANQHEGSPCSSSSSFGAGRLAFHIWPLEFRHLFVGSI